MQVPETDLVWTYSLLSATESKASARTGTPIGSMAELVGIDGTNNGGLMPFPGFRDMHRFAPETATNWIGSNHYSTDAHRSRVVDFWSFNLIAGTNSRVFGFVYIIRRPSDLVAPACNNVYDLMLEFNAPQGSVDAWTTVVIREGVNGGVLADNGGVNSISAVMSVETTGKAIYIFERGLSPIAIYFKATTGPIATTATIINPAGPGIRPKASMYLNGASPPVEADLTGTPDIVIGHLTASFPDPTLSTEPPGSVIFSRVTATDTPSAGSGAVSNLGTASTNQAGTYSLAVQFEDSRSGRKSQLSANVDMTFTGADRRIIIDGVYDTNRFDKLNIYRSVRTSNAGGAFAGGILQLDGSVALAPFHVVSLPMRTGSTSPPFANSAVFRYAYQLKDSALVMQDVFLDKPSYSTTMPKGGAGALLDGTMLVGNISESAGDLTGTGETRWSASGVDSPELFTALGEYKPSSVGDAVTCFKRTGQVMAGLTRNGVQFFNKSAGFVRVLAAHQGYGVTGPYAAATVGPVTYYLNYRGLKAVYPDGRLDDVQSINQLVSSEWYANTTGAQELSKVSMAFDPATLCLYILNPTRQTAVQMWFATGVVSELQDTSFGKVTSGWWRDTDGQLVPRALFLFNAPYPDAVTNTDFRPAVFMPSRNYADKTYPETNVVTQVSMLDGDFIRNPKDPVTSAAHSFQNYDATCTRQTYTAEKITNVFEATAGEQHRMIGAWVYSTFPFAKIGVNNSRARIVDIDANWIYLDNAQSGKLGDTSYYVADPVVFKVTTAALKLTEDKSEEFVVKQPSSLGIVLTDVEYTSGPNLIPIASYWISRIYRENETAPVLSAYPTAPDGTSVQNAMIRGDSPNWAAFGKHGILGQWFFPSVEVFIPNVKYRLVGLQVKGRMLPTDRTRRTY
jgi:hypothetical protein